MADNQTFQYQGKDVDVQWDGRLCIHIGECGFAKGELFVAGRQPWCQPDLSSVQEVIDVVERCPTGALTYKVKDGSTTEVPAEENTVTVVYKGPYYVTGKLDIETNLNDMSGVAYRVALCRCGQSKNKPFCDNAHEEVNFNDYGAVGDKGESLAESGGSLTIQPLKDGPLLFKGNLTIKAASGRNAWQGTSVALCRCGASKNKPFCDGAHQQAGFKSD